MTTADDGRRYLSDTDDPDMQAMHEWCETDDAQPGDPEIAAALAIVHALDGLPDATRGRLLRWVCDRYQTRP